MAFDIYIYSRHSFVLDSTTEDVLFRFLPVRVLFLSVDFVFSFFFFFWFLVCLRTALSVHFSVMFFYDYYLFIFPFYYEKQYLL